MDPDEEVCVLNSRSEGEMGSDEEVCMLKVDVYRLRLSPLFLFTHSAIQREEMDLQTKQNRYVTCIEFIIVR